MEVLVVGKADTMSLVAFLSASDSDLSRSELGFWLSRWTHFDTHLRRAG